MCLLEIARSWLSSRRGQLGTEPASLSSGRTGPAGDVDSAGDATDPLVSVVIPTYNRAEYLPRAIESVRDQTYGEYQIVIVDDGSTDDVRQIVDGYSTDRIEFRSHDRNRGPAAARNTGLAAADGAYVSFLDSDDELEPTCLERSVRRLGSLPAECAGVYVALENRTDGDYTGKFGVAPVHPPSSLIDTATLRLGRLGGLTVRKAALEETGSFDERLRTVEDTDLWVRLLRRYALVGIDEELYVYHQHGDQINRNARRRARSLDRFVSKHRDRLTPKAMAWCQSKLAHLRAADGRFPEAAATFRTVAEIQPWRLSAYYYAWLSNAHPAAYHGPVDVRARLHDVKSKLDSRFARG